jgi:hypothetical protein
LFHWSQRYQFFSLSWCQSVPQAFLFYWAFQYLMYLVIVFLFALSSSL